MTWSQPGTSFTDEELLNTGKEAETLLPVFIGYTEKGTKQTLYSIGSMDEYVSLLGGAAKFIATKPVLYFALKHYFDNGGGNCFVLPAGHYGDLATDFDQGTVANSLQAALACDALERDDRITLLCVPDLVLLDAADAQRQANWLVVWREILSRSRQRQGGFALLDTPQIPAQAKACLELIASDSNAEFGAAYWPHLVSAYTREESEERVVLPPSAALAAVMQRTDRERGVWKAPANVALAQVLKPAASHLSVEDWFDHGAPVNLIRSFPGRGVRVWGCRTLTPSATSPWRYLQVRRLMSYIESQLGTVGRFCVFEPNNEITWFKLKSLCRGWLRTLWLNGALFGGTEEEAFQLHIGLGESMTAEDVLAGRLILRVAVAALYPAEFIEVRLQFNLGDNTVTEEAQ